MNLHLRENNNTVLKNGIEEKINIVMNEIEKEYNFKWNTLENLFSFKLEKAKEITIENSNEYKKALIEEIEKKANSWEITSNNEDILWIAKYEALANKIIEVSKLTQDIQKWIQDLRAEILNDRFRDIFLTSNSLLTKNIYSQKTLDRVDNPNNIWDNLVWLWVGIIESWAIIWKFSYDLGKWILLSPYHVIQLIRWKAQYSWIEI